MKSSATTRSRKVLSSSPNLSTPSPLREVQRRRQSWARVSRVLSLLAFALGVGLVIFWITRLRQPPNQTGEATRWIAEASVAVLHADYVEAERLAALALTMSSDPEHVEFYASIVLGLGRVEDALGYYRTLFKSWKLGSSVLVLQRYFAILHRLGLTQEIESVWGTVKDYVPWTSPLQCPDKVDESLLPGRPFHNAADYRTARLIEENMPAIRKELDEYLQQEQQTQRNGTNALPSFVSNQDIDIVDGHRHVDGYRREAWRELLLYEKGAWKEDLCGAGRPFHRTCKPLRGHLEIEGRYRGFRVGQVSFLRLLPQTHLVAHFGSVNWRLVASCGVIVPSGITIRVGNEHAQWTEGKCLVFDDSFLHEVWHNGSEPRYVFFANFLIVTPD